MKYTGFFVDLDDTLTKSSKLYTPVLHEISDEISDLLGVDRKLLLEAIEREIKYLRLTMSNLPLGHNRVVAFRNTLDKLGVEYNLAQIADIQDLFWEKFIDGLEVYDHVFEVLEALRNAGVKIAIVSDGDLDLRIKKARKVGLLDYVDDLVASEEVVFEKPFGAIFNLALNRLDKNPEEVVMLGNNYINDIHGAQQVGITSGLFKPKRDAAIYHEDQKDLIKPDFIIKDFRELFKIFEI